MTHRYLFMQMTPECFMAWNSTMTCWWKLGHWEMFSQRFFFRRTRRHSPSSKDGHSPERSTLMAMSACCPHQTHTHFCLVLPQQICLPCGIWFPWYCFSCWMLFSDCFHKIRLQMGILKPTELQTGDRIGSIDTGKFINSLKRRQKSLA